jgi:hypothetical protein
MFFVMIIHGVVDLKNIPTPEIPVDLNEPPFTPAEAAGNAHAVTVQLEQIYENT